jgi:type II secretory ATPase GspE/PulE/Tfp pilus assembly ATPase PilB-like protein
VLEPVLSENQGVVLIACPPEEGMTTSLYTLLHSHDPYTQSVVTLEDDIAYQVEGVEHQTVDAGTDNMAFARRVSATLRRTPQVVLLGRPLSAEIAKAVVPEAGSVRFYAGLHQTDAFRGLVAWIKMVGDPREAAEALSAVVAQRLARRLCTTCRIAYKPDPDALRKMNLQPERVGQLYKHSGRITVNNKQEPCPDCAGMGYRGRFAMYEVIVLDDQARQLVAASQIDQLRIHLRKTQKMVWLQEAALVKVVDQTTSISEVNRVLSGQKIQQPGRSVAGRAAGASGSSTSVRVIKPAGGNSNDSTSPAAGP